MKKSEQRLLVFSLIIILLMTINLFTKTLTGPLAHLLFVSVFLLISYGLFGFEKNKVFNKSKLIKYFVLFLFSSMIFIYATGLLCGYFSSPYNRSIMGIFSNIGYLALFYVVNELLRYNVTKKGENSLCVYIDVIIFTTMIDISLNIFYYDLKIKFNILKFITILLIPSIAKNFALTSFSKKYGYEVTIIYQLVVNLYIYLMPIYPALDNFLASCVNFLQPILIWALCKSIFDKETKEDLRSKHIFAKTLTVICVFLSMIVILLFSNLFRFWIAVIGTGSMTPTINVGDIIIVDKYKQDHLDKLEVGEVLVFEIKGKIYCHRIIEVIKSDGSYSFKTKGDRKGQAIDSWIVTEKEVVGTVSFKIPYVGYPTVWLNRMIREK